jgi:hypothetical protein
MEHKNCERGGEKNKNTRTYKSKMKQRENRKCAPLSSLFCLHLTQCNYMGPGGLWSLNAMHVAPDPALCSRFAQARVGSTRRTQGKWRKYSTLITRQTWKVDIYIRYTSCKI